MSVAPTHGVRITRQNAAMPVSMAVTPREDQGSRRGWLGFVVGAEKPESWGFAGVARSLRCERFGGRSHDGFLRLGADVSARAAHADSEPLHLLVQGRRAHAETERGPALIAFGGGEGHEDEPALVLVDEVVQALPIASANPTRLRGAGAALRAAASVVLRHSEAPIAERRTGP